VASEVSSLPALHIYSISESLPFAALTATLILPHYVALKGLLSSVVPPLTASFYCFPAFQGQFKQLGDCKECSYHFT